MRIYGQAMAGGSFATTHVPIPREALSRPGSDIVSRLEAQQARVSPIGAEPTPVPVYVEKPDTTKNPRRAGGFALRFDRVEIAAQYRRGATLASIAKTLGCTEMTVRRALKDQSVPLRGSAK